LNPDGIARQIIAVREGDGVQQEVNISQLFSSHFHESVDLCVVLNIQRLQEGGLAFVLGGAFRHPHPIFLFVVFGLIGKVRKTTNSTVFHDFLSDRPCNGAIVGDPENQSLLALK
jgi:hypothetical protein